MRRHAWALLSLFPVFAQIIFVALLLVSMHVLVCWCFSQKNHQKNHQQKLPVNITGEMTKITKMTVGITKMTVGITKMTKITGKYHQYDRGIFGHFMLVIFAVICITNITALQGLFLHLARPAKISWW